ncbi:MAG TPA: phosphoadenylyl-sulfate reductase [Burkholderiaceae bacterium]
MNAGGRPEVSGLSGVSSLSPLGGAPARASAIELYARPSADYASKLDATIELLKAAAADHAGRIVQATSLGAEDMVVTDLIARLGLPIAIGTLETGKLHPETVALIPRLEQRYGLEVEVYRPREEQVVHFVREHGEDAMYRSLALRKACCGVRKMEPLGRMLEGRGAWITGLRREQSSNRGAVAALETEASGRVKLNPLADWTWNDVWHYITSHDVPYNPLHDEFMPSIGCAPCTRAIAVGEDFRAGRWWWEDESAKECGLHATRTPEAAAA